ncbi:uncharacterized protein SPPG_05661 [Spizellomyces punctatus DAOM BR117]|uniref:Uncharacterized protein n=1 Tax=Spizellomyces punctatus (strain DAOM BR117) TaxID=645134 RepID=A0A0L0HD45_SPIPD|nr:uncharacterized protein SPPG_05661 [Spizellomyces punctatus DAOM BR117]KNC99420.1 hypothetical protein SPPG_05661 [Spizellomyces punctatus DAOM BR117]|eukprot:XP_016607460.1 hypothetical protein SPPG_05661 [Spizellomyces punctatus DAOM BR117]
MASTAFAIVLDDEQDVTTLPVHAEELSPKIPRKFEGRKAQRSFSQEDLEEKMSKAAERKAEHIRNLALKAHQATTHAIETSQAVHESQVAHTQDTYRKLCEKMRMADMLRKEAVEKRGEKRQRRCSVPARVVPDVESKLEAAALRRMQLEEERMEKLKRHEEHAEWVRKRKMGGMVVGV